MIKRPRDTLILILILIFYFHVLAFHRIFGAATNGSTL